MNDTVNPSSLINGSSSGDGLDENKDPGVVHDELSIFLHGVSLGHLYEKFVRNDYLFSNVFAMSEVDMRKIGVSNEDARKLFLAIQDFGLVARPPSSLYDTDDESDKNSEGSLHEDGIRRTTSTLLEMEALQITSGVAKHFLFIETSVGYLRYTLESEPDNFSLNIHSADASMFEVIKAQNTKCKKALARITKTLTEMRENLVGEYGVDVDRRKNLRKLAKSKQKTMHAVIVTSGVIVGMTLVAFMTFKRIYGD